MYLLPLFGRGEIAESQGQDMKHKNARLPIHEYFRVGERKPVRLAGDETDAGGFAPPFTPTTSTEWRLLVAAAAAAAVDGGVVSGTSDTPRGPLSLLSGFSRLL